MNPELWFSEKHSKHAKFSIRVNKQLYAGKSKFQRIDVFDTPEFGRCLVLDGRMMLTEKDEFIYHDMLTHVPMAVNLAIKKVLIIGGGDGGCLRELCRYETIESVDLVEIDRAVVKVCKKHIPKVAAAFDDPRLTLYIEDGLRFVRQQENAYDLIIVDSTDPFGPGESLYTREFYGNCLKALTENGIMVNQHESPYYKNDARAVKDTWRKTKSIFPLVRLYQAHIPTYPSGHWLFGFMSKGLDPLKDHQAEQWESLGLTTKYYNSALHQGAFALPNYVLKMLAQVDKQRLAEGDSEEE